MAQATPCVDRARQRDSAAGTPLIPEHPGLIAIPAAERFLNLQGQRGKDSIVDIEMSP